MHGTNMKIQNVKFLIRYSNATCIKLTVANNNRLMAYSMDFSQQAANGTENLMEHNTRCNGEINTTRRIARL